MKILVFPRDPNPYQALLYAPFGIRGHDVRYLVWPTGSATANLMAVIPGLVWSRLWGYTIFHLHWTFAFGLKNRPYQSILAQRLIYWHYLACLLAIKILGYKLVWTAHNVIPHEPVFLDDAAARRALVRRADLVIGHSQSTRQALAKIGAYPKRLVVIPHGTYVDVYPNTISRREARASLGITDTDFVYAYVGHVRGYKGVESLIEAHSQITETKLIIAGECREDALRDRLKQSHRDVIWQDGYVADEDLQRYFAAADVIVLPFTAVTTSGSALLALSFGRPIIGPSLGDLALLPGNIAYLYAADDPGGLLAAMKYASVHREEFEQREKDALTYAGSSSWDQIAAETIQAFTEIQ